MAAENILIIEDDINIAELIAVNLSKSGYKYRKAESAESALLILKKEKFDLILLDLMLPKMDGYDFCKLLRRTENLAQTPVIMLSALSEDADIVSGLELGANDYITKPFSPRVLLARIKTRLSDAKSKNSGLEKTLSLNGIELDEKFREIKIDGAPVEMTANEFSILQLFMSNPGRVYTRDDIIGHLHGPGYAVTDRAIDVQIVGLRKKLGAKSELLETVRGIGYRFAKKPAIRNDKE